MLRIIGEVGLRGRVSVVATPVKNADSRDGYQPEPIAGTIAVGVLLDVRSPQDQGCYSIVAPAPCATSARANIGVVPVKNYHPHRPILTPTDSDDKRFYWSMMMVAV